MSRAGRCVLVCMAGMLALVGCDPRSGGAGVLTVTVDWPGDVAPLGAALVYVGGEGYGEVTGQAGAMAWSHTPAGEEGGLRVLVLHPGTPSSLQFTVQVPETERPAPEAIFLRLADQENEVVDPLPAEGYRIRVSGAP